MAATTTAQQNPENHMKTLDEPSDPKPAAESVSPPDSASDSPKSPPSDGAKEEIKAAGGDDSCQGNDIQKKMKRAERFGMPVQLSEEEKRSSRAERFGTGSPVQGSDALKKSEEHKRQARAERFGIVKSDTTDEEAKKKKARLTRFAPPGKADPMEEDKRKARALRFSQPQPGSQPQANGKGNIEQIDTKEVLFNYLVSPEAAVPQFDWVQQEFLKSHNDLRSSVGIPHLRWDANLAAFSQSWANQRKQQCDYRHHSTSPYGENIFWELYRQNTATSIVQKWFGEKQFFNHATNQCNCQPERAGCECGHYLNVIWRTTTKVGCSGFVYCDDQKGAIVVCSYDPIGNVKGVNPLNPVNNMRGVAPPVLPPRQVNNGGRGRKRNVAVKPVALPANARLTSPVLPPKPVNTGNVRRGRGRKHNVAVKSPAPLKRPSSPQKSQRGRGRRNNRV